MFIAYNSICLCKARSLRNGVLMFKTEEFVVKANSGICKIVEITELDLLDDGNFIPYYVVVPMDEKSSKLFVPVNTASNVLRYVIDETRAWEIINMVSSIPEPVFENDKVRETKYKEAIKSCEPETLVGIIKSMFSRKKARIEQGKKSFAIDDHFFKLAENCLYSELAFATGKEKSDIEKIITDIINNNGEQ